MPWLGTLVRPFGREGGWYCNFNSDDEVVGSSLTTSPPGGLPRHDAALPVVGSAVGLERPNGRKPEEDADLGRSFSERRPSGGFAGCRCCGRCSRLCRGRLGRRGATSGSTWHWPVWRPSFSAFLGFAIARSRERLVLVQNLIARDNASLLSIHQMVAAFSKTDRERIRGLIDHHLIDQIDYRLVDHHMAGSSTSVLDAVCLRPGSANSSTGSDVQGTRGPVRQYGARS